ncbi:MAG: glutamine--fructose-6-phosphate transaminase (isomerizing) [Myxococcales bacterium]|nr:glutamine--fructose-6-phosphate transaminase (isomerizing) [Myxococcales bacterium]MCB9534024.1 glutamine--fructose-6-phosphate transaminase (isomerizing) [Myxococcales bacterium]
MCGIVGYVGDRQCGEILVDGLRRLEYRGYDSAGVAIWDGKEVIRIRAEGKLRELERRFAQVAPTGTVGIAHTRWATHGPPVERNAHPHAVGRITLVHNGIIENYSELREELARDGATFTSDTDTEIVAHLVSAALGRTATLRDAVVDALGRVRGSYALVVLDAGRPDQLVVARNASPLVLGVGDGEYFAASDVPAIMLHTRDVIFLEDGDVATLSRAGIDIIDADRMPVRREPRRILWDPISAEKQGYKHFMLKEIHEQPARLVDTLRGRVHPDLHTVELAEVRLDPAWVANIDRIVILACGTSWHAGMVGRYAIESLSRLPVEVDLASEFRYRQPVLTDRTLAIAISQSGETADTLAAIREAQRLGAKTLSICNVMESTIARECQNVIYTQAGPEIGVASTKAFTTQLVALYLLAIWLGQHRKTITDARRAELVDALRRLPGAVEKVTELEEPIRAMAKEFTSATSFLFLGRGNLYPIALEGALKLKEISYIHAEGYASGEMKHGPIALIDEALPIVILAPQGPLYEKTVSNLEEVKARGGRLITVTSGPSHALKPFSDHVLDLPEVEDIFMPVVAVVPLQLLSYCVADAKGTDIDQPRNLAKSVTVE